MVRDGLPILMDGNRHVSSEASNAVSVQRFKGMIDEAISKQNVNQMRQGETRGNSLLSMDKNVLTPQPPSPPSSNAAPSTTEGNSTSIENVGIPRNLLTSYNPPSREVSSGTRSGANHHRNPRDPIPSSCPLCAKNFSSRNQMNIHMKSVHGSGSRM